MLSRVQLLVFNLIVVFNIQSSVQCPETIQDAKAAYKSGEILDQGPPITLQRIKTKLRESGVFDIHEPTLSDQEKKQLARLFDAVEIMTTSRNRQPITQNMFSALRIVERAVKKQLKEGQISETLAAKFNWEKILARQRRERHFTMVSSNQKKLFKQLDKVPPVS